MSPLALSSRLLQAQPDERLLALAGAGHEPAFEALVRRYRRALLAYCRRLTAPETNAEDILQQALLQAWRALGAGVEVRDVRAWLYRIVHNAAISSVRGTGEPPAELGNAIRAVGVEQLVEQRMAAREALAGLAALPALQREVMVETALEGRSHEEVARALGLSDGSVRGLIYRARAALRAAAAALIPGPLLSWAARQDLAPAAGTAAVAGGGSAGIAGAVFKGGAVVTVAGAIAGTAVVAVHPFQRHPTSARAGAPRPREATADRRRHRLERVGRPATRVRRRRDSAGIRGEHPDTPRRERRVRRSRQCRALPHRDLGRTPLHGI